MTIISQLADLRKLYAEAQPEDPRVINDYAWTMVKALLHNTSDIDSVTARRLLADCIKLPLQRPSQIYSALLAAAVKVAKVYPEFHFAVFLKMWGQQNLMPEDYEKQTSQDGKSFPSLAERTAKALANSLLLHQEDRALGLTATGFSVCPMLVTRIKESTGKDGRKYRFVTLTSQEGIEMECISNLLQPSPLHPLPEGKRHYVNIGQLYDCLLHSTNSTSSSADQKLSLAYLSLQRPTDLFPTAIGYVESIDTAHGHMHIYDNQSRHFVAHILRFSREKVGDFVRFIPVTPLQSRFKTAVILSVMPSSSEEILNVLREIRITQVNKEKHYAAWELIDKEQPITEHLSALQLSQGEASPVFTSGYFSLETLPAEFPASNVKDSASSVASLSASNNKSQSESYFVQGQHLRAFIYLRRGKDKLKRPHVAVISKS